MRRIDHYNIALLANHSIEELAVYSKVFNERIVAAFESLEDEARSIQEDAYAKSGANAGPDDDPGIAAEDAYHEGVSFYLATDSIRQGVVNLMVAGLYHLFEQHVRVLNLEVTGTASERGTKDLTNFLSQNGISIQQIPGWQQIDELRLVANATKHGDGSSAADLKNRNPQLFERYPNLSHGLSSNRPLRPLAGEGLYLSASNFQRYHAALVEFWQSLPQTVKAKVP